MSEKFISPCLPPEGRERELLTILAEECNEVGQRICKALRFGITEVQPGQEFDNADRIAHEVGDILEVVDALFEAGVLSLSAVEAGRVNKKRQLAKFMQTA